MKFWYIAANTFREIIRDRILYGLLVFALFIIGFSLVLGQLSFAEQTRISANFGFSAIHLSATVLAVFMGSTLVAKEIDKQTIMTLLVRPILREEFLLGKFLGLALAIMTVMAGLSLVVGLVFWGLGFGWSWNASCILWGIALEAAVMLAFTMLFGVISRPVLVVVFSVGIYLIGHWQNSLAYFSGESQSVVFQVVGKVVNSLLPNLDTFNWREMILVEDRIPLQQVALASANAFFWIVFTMTLAALLFRRRDFV